MDEEEVVNWNVDMEVSLFHAIHAHRPIGINRHFQMIFLHDKFNSAIDKKVSTADIWNHLKEMYDLVALNDSEGIPSANKESDFELPESICDELCDKPFPRYVVSEDLKQSEAESGKEGSKDQSHVLDTSTSSKDTVDQKASSSGSRGASSKTSADTVAKSDDVSKAVDSPKPDPRKRTRHSLQSPQTDTNNSATPGSAKRSRRI